MHSREGGNQEVKTSNRTSKQRWVKLDDGINAFKARLHDEYIKFACAPCLTSICSPRSPPCNHVTGSMITRLATNAFSVVRSARGLRGGVVLLVRSAKHNRFVFRQFGAQVGECGRMKAHVLHAERLN